VSKTSFKDVLDDCHQRKRSLVAFNVQNVYHLDALTEVTDDLELPAIAQCSARFVKQFENRHGMARIVDKYQNERIHFHLDHCQDIDLIKFCVDSGFNGVMFDGSALPLTENMTITKEVMRIASESGCVVEGELGEIGGVEDGEGTEEMSYANLEEVKQFVDETGVQLLALGIGNAHGVYKTLKNIDTTILAKAKDVIGRKQLFVLHGGTGLPHETVLDAINSGVVKINYSTQLKMATNDAISSFLESGILFNEVAFEKAIHEQVKPLFKTLIQRFTQ
jgi:ketose-bisphosphate aldolase